MLFLPQKLDPYPSQAERIARLQFAQYLSMAIIRGVILFVDYAEAAVNLICVPSFICGSVIYSGVNISTLNGMHELQVLSPQHNSNSLSGVAFASLPFPVSPESSCTLMGQMQPYRTFEQEAPNLIKL